MAATPGRRRGPLPKLRVQGGGGTRRISGARCTVILWRRPQGGGGGHRRSSGSREEEGPVACLVRAAPLFCGGDPREEEGATAEAQGPGRRRDPSHLWCVLHRYSVAATPGRRRGPPPKLRVQGGGGTRRITGACRTFILWQQPQGGGGGCCRSLGSREEEGPVA